MSGYVVVCPPIRSRKTPTARSRLASVEGFLPSVSSELSPAPIPSRSRSPTASRSVHGAAWPDLSDAVWERLARRSYRANPQGIPEVDADPLIGEPLRDPRAAAPDLWPLWSALAQLPVLAIRGEHSDILSAATLARMQKKPALTALSVANRGHAPLLDEPGCVAAIDAFLAALPGAVG